MTKILFVKSTLLFLTLLIIVSCNRDRSLKEGIETDFIQYEVIYLEKMAGDIPTSVLPKTMQAYYTKDFVLTRIDGFFGQFSLVQIADLKKHTVTSMLSFLGNNIYYCGMKGDLPVGIQPLERPLFRYTDDTLTISGLKSKRAVVELPEESYDIYYTEEITIKSPNITTSYFSIDHVLSDFRVQLSYLKMRLIIQNHEKKIVDHIFFDVPENYEQVSLETMENIINNLFTKE